MHHPQLPPANVQPVHLRHRLGAKASITPTLVSENVLMDILLLDNCSGCARERGGATDGPMPLSSSMCTTVSRSARRSSSRRSAARSRRQPRTPAPPSAGEHTRERPRSVCRDIEVAHDGTGHRQCPSLSGGANESAMPRVQADLARVGVHPQHVLSLLLRQKQFAQRAGLRGSICPTGVRTPTTSLRMRQR
jgi:hypothetical protein